MKGTLIAAGVGLAILVSAGEVRPVATQEQMSPEQKKMMDAMQMAGTPGKQHEWLATKAGEWKAAGKFWMEPGQPPMEWNGTAERSMMLDGRVLVENVSGPGFMGGPPFEGHGLMGYNNVTKEYWGTWNDNMSTGVMVSHGSCDDKGSCEFTSEYVDPVSGKVKMRSTLRDDGEGREIHEAFATGADGQETKTMEFVYERVK